MTTIRIRTRYVTRPGSNVGTYRATGAGRTFTAPPRQDLNANAAEEVAARALASIISGFDAGNVRQWSRLVPAHDIIAAPMPRPDTALPSSSTPPGRVGIRRESDTERVTVWSVTL